MQYAQLNPDGSYSRQITTGGNVAWDENHFCPAAALTAAEAAMFHVVTLLEIEPPPFNFLTQSCQRNGGELVNGQWQYKWDVTELDAATSAANLLAAQLAKADQIKAERDTRKNGGTLVSGKWFHSDSDSRIQQLGLLMMGAAVPAVQWKTLDGSFTTMSQALAGGIFQATAALDMALFSNCEAHIKAVRLAADPSTYDFSTGWPASYAQI